MHRVINQLNAFKLNEYQGTYEVVSGNDNDGTFYMAWAIASEYDSGTNSSKPFKKEDGKYRNVPIKVVLGDKEEAIENLKWLLKQLEGESPSPEPGSPEPLLSGDVPF